MKITEKDVSRCYETLKKEASKAIRKNQINKGLHIVNRAAFWMYKFNARYSDEELDLLLKCVSNQLLGEKIIQAKNDGSLRVSFIDSFCFDNRCLTEQYLAGLSAAGVRLQYICTSVENEIGENIKNFLEDMDAEIVRIPCRGDVASGATRIVDAISKFQPSKVFFQIYPWDVIPIVAGYALKGVQKYNINLTDHAYWLGSGLFDYNYEFRGYGELVSLQKRGFKPSQIIRMPYYPITHKNGAFYGFPKLPEDPIIIICGGAEYKFLGHNDMFFCIMETLLDISPKVVILVAGVNDKSVFSAKVKNLKNSDRVFNIGFRRDINEVFKHSDIFLNSYPISGGLMTQYAGVNALPLVALKNPDTSDIIDGVINQKCQGARSLHSLEELNEYATKLILDIEFRKREGLRANQSMITKEEFNQYLKHSLDGSLNSEISWPLSHPNYYGIRKCYIDNENNGTHSADWILIGALRLRAFLVFPSRFFSFTSKAVSYALMKFKGEVK